MKDNENPDNTQGLMVPKPDQNQFVERKPLLIASSAMLTEEIIQECLSVGFNKVTNVPITRDFIESFLSETRAR